MDGNGRTARVLESLVMYAGGFKSEELVSLETYYGQDNQAYYQALSAALGPHYAPPKDVTLWLEYHTHAHASQSMEAAALSSGFVGLTRSLEELALSPQQQVALWVACRSGPITNRDYREHMHLSAQEAIADFNLLIQKGLLVRIGGGRSTAYVPSDKLRQLYTAALSDPR